MMNALEPLFVDRRTPFQKLVDGDGPKALPSYVYIASSWKNLLQQGVVGALRSLNIPHYDCRQPTPDSSGFRWSEVDPTWKVASLDDWRKALSHPIAQAGFTNDKAAMDRADCCVLVLPAGRSAHLEAGYIAAQSKPVLAFSLEAQEWELMALLLGPPEHICTTMDELFDRLGIG